MSSIVRLTGSLSRAMRAMRAMTSALVSVAASASIRPRRYPESDWPSDLARSRRTEEISYDFDELAHAYAVTIHRSQGSEYPAVVIPLTISAWMMLQRNLLYTGITRAKKLVVLAGSRKALAAAIRTAGTGRRHTAIAHRLQMVI
jgi:hypothetical protein